MSATAGSSLTRSYTQIASWPLGPSCSMIELRPVATLHLQPVQRPVHVLLHQHQQEPHLRYRTIRSFNAVGFPKPDDDAYGGPSGRMDLNGLVLRGRTRCGTGDQHRVLYVNWVNVGYFNANTDLLNSFQLIPDRRNGPGDDGEEERELLCRDMQWTAEMPPVDGRLRRTPAVVGANRGNGVDYIQFGTFDQPGNVYDGPFGSPDGVDWLDNKNFTFTTAVSTQNIPPIASSQFLCDTIVVCAGEQVNVEMSFIAPEQNQTVNASRNRRPPEQPCGDREHQRRHHRRDGQPVPPPLPSEVGFHHRLQRTDNGALPHDPGEHRGGSGAIARCTPGHHRASRSCR